LYTVPIPHRRDLAASGVLLFEEHGKVAPSWTQWLQKSSLQMLLRFEFLTEEIRGASIMNNDDLRAFVPNGAWGITPRARARSEPERTEAPSIRTFGSAASRAWPRWAASILSENSRVFIVLSIYMATEKAVGRSTGKPNLE
jgi:hypothetical protein